VSAPPTLLFVYGTLMRGEANAPFLDGCVFLGPTLTASSYTLLDLGECPAMRPGGSTAVAGELYEVDAETVADLDALEGEPYQYHRATVRLADGREAQSFLLPVAVPEAPPIPSGDWRRRDPVG
jgi:gamma-glutamylaminecyclotransferase